MIPLRDTIPSRRWPAMTWLLIIVNVVIFFLQRSLTPPYSAQLVREYGLIPARFLAAAQGNTWEIIPFFSYMFLHGGWFHTISNMWALWLFGDNVEDRMGSFRFLCFYLIMGIIAGAAHLFSQPLSTFPIIGASGAIAGVMGAYFIMFPKSRIVTLVPLFFIPWFLQIPAVVYLGFWLLSQIYSALTTQPTGAVSNIAWWAHIGGFAAGLLFHRLFFQPYRSRYRY